MKILQILINGNWEYIFCWSVNQGKIITTKRSEAAIKDVGTNFQYFSDLTDKSIRAISVNHEQSKL